MAPERTSVRIQTPVVIRAALLAGLLVAGAAAAQGTGSVAGQITDELGNPIAGAVVSLVPGGPSTVTDENGSFVLHAPAGNYLLRVTAENYHSDDVPVVVTEDGQAHANLTVQSPRAVGLEWFPFVFLGVAMVAVIAGGFYVNKRMSETGVEFDKSVLGGARARKPFRRRRGPKAPPPSP